MTLSERIAKLFEPRDRLTVSQWADMHRVLSPKASSEPGPWRTSRMPHLREIMDSLSEHVDCEEVWMMKPAQSGGTEVATNWIGYIMDYVASAKPTLIVLPTISLLVRWVHQRLRPMIENAEVLRDKLDVSKSRDGTNRLDIIDYPGGLLYLTTAGSAPNLKSDSICYVIGDEIDEYDVDIGGRGDPFRLLASRQANFPRRKRLMFSTPSVEGASRVAQGYESSDQRRRIVPCPHCGAEQELVWENLRWDQDVTRVWYTCAENGCVIEERSKDAMLAAGRWVPRYPERKKIRGYHWNALYNPTGLGYSWAELVREWLDAQGDDAKLQPFVNERLGLPWQDRRSSTSAEDLQSRALAYPLRTIPSGSDIALITAGVDTQDDRLEVQIIGWRSDGAFWVLDYAILPGDPGRKDVWDALTALFGRPFATPSGMTVGIDCVAVDLGGHHTEPAKAYIREMSRRRGSRIIGIFGGRHRMTSPLGKPRLTDFTAGGRTVRRGMHYYPVGTDVAKDRLYGILRGDSICDPDDRMAHFSAELPSPEYFAGLLSEIWNPKRQRYERRRGYTKRNEPLDTWVYAYAAGHYPGLPVRLDRGAAREWQARTSRWHDEQAPAPAPEPEPQDQQHHALIPPPPPEAPSPKRARRRYRVEKGRGPTA